MIRVVWKSFSGSRRPVKAKQNSYGSGFRLADHPSQLGLLTRKSGKSNYRLETAFSFWADHAVREFRITESPSLRTEASDRADASDFTSLGACAAT